MKTILKSSGQLTPSPAPFTVKASGSYESEPYQLLLCDDSVADWIAANSCLSELTAADAMTWLIRLQNPFQKLSDAIQKHLDDKAKEKNYDGILSACSYATSTNAKFKAEGQALVNWRDAVWAKCYQIMADVQSGSRAIPTEAEIISEMPAFTWPEVS